jgi:hypothetical protein
MQIKLIFLLKNIKIFYFSFDFAIIIVVISEIITIFAALNDAYKMMESPLSAGTKVAMHDDKFSSLCVGMKCTTVNNPAGW